MSDSYYNTPGTSGQELAKRERKAKSQEELILDWFERLPGMCYAPSEVQKRLGLMAVPITSIRRAMTNLTKRRRLRKTAQQVTGPYQHAEHTWTLNRNWPDEQGELF